MDCPNIQVSTHFLLAQCTFFILPLVSSTSGLTLQSSVLMKSQHIIATAVKLSEQHL